MIATTLARRWFFLRNEMSVCSSARAVIKPEANESRFIAAPSAEPCERQFRQVTLVQTDKSGDARKEAAAVQKPVSHRHRIQIPSHTPVLGSPLGTFLCLIQARLAV